MTTDEHSPEADRQKQRAPSSVSEKLNFLIERRKKNGGTYKSVHLAKFVEEKTKGSCTPAYISKLKNGKGDLQISWAKLEAIALFFEVSADFFREDYDWSPERLGAQLDLLAALGKGDARLRAARAILGMKQDEVTAMLPQLTALVDKINSGSAASTPPPQRQGAEGRPATLLPQFRAATSGDPQEQGGPL
ncbi:hypothetical protein [Amycolatopsis sp. NPDC059657]|uniref:hypothetical protein n=1 Tax=Amycolatopsis sp. NPDC059657 TaxID=3346899 RepID=UPI00366FDF21